MNSARKHRSMLKLASGGGRANGQSVHNDPEKAEKQKGSSAEFVGTAGEEKG
jgi:hypothetical protein